MQNYFTFLVVYVTIFSLHMDVCVCVLRDDSTALTSHEGQKALVAVVGCMKSNGPLHTLKA